MLEVVRGGQPFPTVSRLFTTEPPNGDIQSVIELARQQLDECQMDACVANGPAYEAGFGLVSAAGPNHFVDRDILFTALERILNTRAKAW